MPKYRINRLQKIKRGVGIEKVYRQNLIFQEYYPSGTVLVEIGKAIGRLTDGILPTATKYGTNISSLTAYFTFNNTFTINIDRVKNGLVFNSPGSVVGAWDSGTYGMEVSVSSITQNTKVPKSLITGSKRFVIANKAPLDAPGEVYGMLVGKILYIYIGSSTSNASTHNSSRIITYGSGKNIQSDSWLIVNSITAY